MIHELKCWPEFFHAVFMGKKNFEVRKNDRDFKEGDYLTLHEWDSESGQYTGQKLSRRITYILPGGKFGIEDGYVVIGF